MLILTQKYQSHEIFPFFTCVAHVKNVAIREPKQKEQIVCVAKFINRNKQRVLEFQLKTERKKRKL